MDKFDINDVVRKYEWGMPALFLVLGIVLIGLFVQVFLLPKFAELRQVKHQVALESDRLSQYRDLKSFTSKLGEQKQKITNILANQDINPGNINDTLEGISALASAAGIKLDNISADSGVDGQVWNLSFSADSRQMVSFIGILERNYKIKTFSAGGGKEIPHITIAIISINGSHVKNNQGTAVIDTSGELYDLGQKATMHLSEIEKLPASRPVIEVKRDLFSDRMIEDPAKQIVKKPEPKKPRIPAMHLSSISWDPETPVAVIENMVLKEGDTYNGIHVVKINRKSVHIKWHEIDATLELHKQKGE